MNTKPLVKGKFSEDFTYFTTDLEYAKSYARGSEKATLYSVFLNIKNPLDYRLENYEDYARYAHLVKDGTRVKSEDYEIENKLVAKLQKEGKLEGYDGIVGNDAKNWWAEGLGLKSISDGTEYVTFNSNQIKSATDNTGAFSTTNDDIYDNISKLISEKDASVNQTSPEVVTPAETKEVEVKEVTVADNNEPTVDLNTGLNIGKVRDRRKRKSGAKVNPKPTRLVPSRLTWGVWEGFTNDDNESIDIDMTLKNLSKFYTEEQWNQLSDEEMEHELKCKGMK